MRDNLRRQAAEQQIGGKTRLRDFEGVGDTTLREMRSKGFRNLEDVQSATVNELAEVDGIGQTKAERIKEQAPRDTSRSRTSGSVSAAGIRSPVGDFRVGLGDKDRVDARHTTRTRGDNAVRTDNRRRAPITTDEDKWKENPGRFDYPGVDTPTDDPQLKRMDIRRGDVERDDLTRRGKNFLDEIQSLKDKQERRQSADFSASGNDMFLSDEQAAAGLDDSDLGRELFQAQAVESDVSLSPGEAFDGVGTGGRANRSGGDVPVTDRFGRFDKDPEQEQQELDRIAAEKASSGMPKSVIESFAGGEEADMAFAQAEQERANDDKDMFDITEVMGGR
ncbi:helix-hairpin-helix domain-containing protein [Natronomonas sp. F2-12]|uniref:Helix-hairpin-helix domain-containing protein n=1 Tax=Natronomonas aquatica TaxID=2841590 RepID=A0A9R1CVG1_9EURY|nr:helix-hairpin-helix domain-containing protein [Natronomonas aquatica]MCQ4334595.1 helix-hairpin-helix domain-containing protein [Natronomonas aquatica]